MMEENKKMVTESMVEQTYLIMPHCLNAAGYLFGGQLVCWIDETAVIVARRHCNMDVMTVAIDNMHFQAAATLNDTIVLIGRITYVGKSSMEVRVDSYTEQLDGTRKLINRAYLVMVGIGSDHRPAIVPGLILQNSEEQEEWEAGAKRAELRKLRRIEGY